MTIIDTHAHLDQVADIAGVLNEAWIAGVESILAVGEDLLSNKRNLEISRIFSQPRVFVGLGLHPGKIETSPIDECLDFMTEHIDEAKAVGETGLDYWYPSVRKDETKKEEQRSVFLRQLTLARDHHLPAVIHSRGAWRDCLEMAKSQRITKAVFHWYSGPLDVLQDILAAGYFVSASPSLAYSPQAKAAMVHAPIERTLIETDCPVFYRFPDGNKWAARPRDVWKTLQFYAELKNIPADDAVEVLNDNARKFFALP